MTLFQSWSFFNFTYIVEFHNRNNHAKIFFGEIEYLRQFQILGKFFIFQTFSVEPTLEVHRCFQQHL